MTMVRTIKCDVCGNIESEKEYGAGWPGWAIIHGIAAVEPKNDEPLTDANMKFMLCKEHTKTTSNFLSDMQAIRKIEET